MARANILKAILHSVSHREGIEPVDQLKKTLEEYFALRVFPVNSGRSAIYLLLKAAEVGEGDEVIIQAYTCNAVPNPIVWTGAKPVYADIDPETLDVNPVDFEKKISKNTKAVILQHTFGRPGPIKEILEIAKKHKLLVFEDCAHSLGAKYNGKLLGTFGDAAIVSFGREKIISSMAGGAILVKNEKLMKNVINQVSQLPQTPLRRMGSEFFNYFTWRALLRRVYFKERGQNLIKTLNKTDFFNVVTNSKERIGEKPDFYPGQMPNVLAEIAIEEFKNLDSYNRGRNDIAEYYYDQAKNPDFKLLPKHEGIYLRFVALHPRADEVLQEAKRRQFWFGNWYNTPVYPHGVDEKALGYERGSCPKAEKAAKQTVNLPNFINMSREEAQEVVEFINNFQ